MKACVLHAVNDLRHEDVPAPARKKGEVLVKIRASGICGSDVQRVFEKGTYHFPTIPGHEFSGDIIDADDATMIGRKCTVFPLIPCRKCESCAAWRYAQCEDYNYFGSRCDGGFAEFISVPRWNVVLAPDSLSYDEIAMTEPCAVALHGVEQADISTGARVCVFGAGPIGLMAAKWAAIKGASVISVIDVDEKKAAFAKELGFGTAITGLYDAALECSGSSAGFESAVSVTKTFGTVVLVGNPTGDMTLSQKTYWKVLREELTLKGIWNSSYSPGQNNWKTALELMHMLGLKDIISHRFGFHECNEAFSLMKDRGEFVSKVMFINA